MIRIGSKNTLACLADNLDGRSFGHLDVRHGQPIEDDNLGDAVDVAVYN